MNRPAVQDTQQTTALVNQRALPGMELLPAKPITVVPTYLCIACWRRIPVGQHRHACFYKE